MPLEMDSTERNVLILIKSVYRQAEIDAAIPFGFHRHLSAIIGFDWAIETSLKTIIKNSDQTVDLRYINFPNLIKEADKALKEKGMVIPDKSNISNVRDIRNNAQHAAMLPSPQNLLRCQVYTQDYLRKVFSEFWNADFDQFSLAGAIEDEEIRSKIAEAETALVEEQYLDAAAKAKRAFYDALLKYIGGYRETGMSTSARMENPLLEPILDEINEVWYRIAIIETGIDMAEFKRFENTTSSLKRVAGGSIFDFEYGMKPTPEKDARFVVSFCTNTILYIQERFESIG